MRRRNVLTAVGILTALMLLLGVVMVSGCGKETTSKKTDVDNTGQEGEEEGKVEDGEEVGAQKVKIFLLKGENPVEVERLASEPGAQAALEVLLGGPFPEEKKEGLDSAIPAETRLLDYQEALEGSKSIATADFSLEMLDFGGGAAFVEAIKSQITRTVQANSPVVEEVRVLVEGAPAEEVLQP